MCLCSLINTPRKLESVEGIVGGVALLECQSEMYILLRYDTSSLWHFRHVGGWLFSGVCVPGYCAVSRYVM